MDVIVDIVDSIYVRTLVQGISVWALCTHYTNVRYYKLSRPVPSGALVGLKKFEMDLELSLGFAWAPHKIGVFKII